ncbi:unnamed protein product [Arctia plantaginis]|uniref:Uncharacterized protein n=1 Tax=Arctia plantaginis TaxID=874455 RepID=A0A8S1BMA2_ARCPL|nr:unnamed protein product [Arctia plantaginis]
MRSLVVLFAIVAVAVAAPHVGPAVTYSVRAIGYSVPAAVSHQSRVDVRSSPAVVVTAPVEVAAPAVYAGASAISHQSRVDVRTSPEVVAAAPAEVVSAVVAPAVYAGASAVSHQSRVDVHNSPAVVTEQVFATAPVVAQQVVDAPTVIEARSLYTAPVLSAYQGGASVSHQSRYDVHSSPAVVTNQFVAPAVYSAW